MRHLATHRPLAVSTLSGTVTQLGNGAFPVAAVALAAERAGSPEAAGWIVTAFSVGGLLGAVLLAWRPVRRWGPHRVMLLSFLGTGLGTFAAAAVPGYAAALLAVAVAGLFVAPGVAAMLGIRQEESPPEVRSQVFTVGAGLRASAAAVGAAVGGALGGIGGSALTALIAVSWIASAALLLLHRPGRHRPGLKSPAPRGAEA
jgi:MFS family permease